jgi:hypothetical protein
MKKFRLSFALLMMALVLAVVPAAFAQDSTFGASQEDYDLWTSVNASLASTVASMDFTATVSVTGLGEGSDMNAEITGTGALDLSDMANPKLWLDLSGSATSEGETETMSANLRIVDGFIYTNSGDGWEMSPLEDQLSSLTDELGGMTGMGEIDPSDLSTDGAMGDAAAALSQFDLPQYVSLTRNGDQFTLAFDIGGFIASPEISGMVLGLSGMAGDTSEMSDEQMQMMGQQIAMLFADSSVTFDEYIDADAGQLNRAVLDISIPLDGMLGPGAGLAVNFDLNLSNHGEPVTVEVPEGAVLVEAGS